jgi:hypothetical protein
MRDVSYERLSQGETQPVAGGSRSQSPHSFVRPPIYYGDGPFDPPSSDDEDEEQGSFLDKDGPSSPGQAEAGPGPGWTNNTDGKVRAMVHRHHPRSFCIALAADECFIFLEIFITLLRYPACCHCWSCRVNWTNSCFNIYRLFNVSTSRIQKNYIGRCAWWYV